MKLKSGLTAAAAVLAISAGLSGQPAWSQPSGVKAGVLTCNVDSGWGLVFGSTRDLKCVYADNNGRSERYAGHIDKYGVDIGYKAASVIAWLVIAPTEKLGDGALAGNYGGVTAGAAFGVGGSANVLVGGSNQTISLQPVSFEGMTGINVAAGIAGVVLKQVE
jgi:hypothetical protein